MINDIYQTKHGGNCAVEENSESSHDSHDPQDKVRREVGN